MNAKLCTSLYFVKDNPADELDDAIVNYLKVGERVRRLTESVVRAFAFPTDHGPTSSDHFDQSLSRLNRIR